MLSTDRLILREWCQDDLVPFSHINADPEVMRFFTSVLTQEETQAAIERASNHISEHGFGFWAAELKKTSECVGFIGMQHAP